MHRELHHRLIQAAGEHDGFVHYDEVAEILGLPKDRLDHSPVMNSALDEISIYEHENGRPLLPAVVVHKTDLRPGDGFFKMAKRNGVQPPDIDDEAFFVTELRRAHEYWQQHQE